jgi:hypothetical protein
MDRHRKVLGMLFCVIGGLLFFIVGMTFIRNFSTGSAEQVLLNLVFVPAFFLMMFGGFYLVKNKPWAFKICLPVAFCNLIFIPIGTVLGLYYLWFHHKYVKNKI